MSKTKATSNSDYQNVFERAFDGQMNPEPLIQGLGTIDAAKTALGAANKYDARTEHKAMIAERIKELQR